MKTIPKSFIISESTVFSYKSSSLLTATYFEVYLKMSAGQQYRALFDFVSNGQGVLTFKAGDRFTLVSKTDESWWLVRTVSGENGLAPISYLEACHVSVFR